MVIGTARLTVQIPASRSLKDKRQVLRSLLDQTRNEFRLAAAEVDALDQHQLAVVGLAVVSNDARHADEMIARAVRFFESRLYEGHLVAVETELLHPF